MQNSRENCFNILIFNNNKINRDAIDKFDSNFDKLQIRVFKRYYMNLAVITTMREKCYIDLILIYLRNIKNNASKGKNNVSKILRFKLKNANNIEI